MKNINHINKVINQGNKAILFRNTLYKLNVSQFINNSIKYIKIKDITKPKKQKLRFS